MQEQVQAGAEPGGLAVLEGLSITCLCCRVPWGPSGCGWKDEGPESQPGNARDLSLSWEAPGSSLTLPSSVRSVQAPGLCAGELSYIVGSFESVINEEAGDRLAGHPTGSSLILF